MQEINGLLSRRTFLVGAGALGVAGAMTGCGDDTAPYVDAAAQPELDRLNFILNLEYLQATLYAYVVTGKDLNSTFTGGGPAPSGVPSQLSFPNQQIADLFAEMYYDEMAHVSGLRTVLGSLAIARPQLNLAAIAPVNASNVIQIARLLEDVAVTAYNGIASGLTGSNSLGAAQILSVEGFHAGALRLIAIQQNVDYPTDTGYVPADGFDVKPGDPGTTALAMAGPTTANGGFFATSAAGVPGQANTPYGFAYQRSPSQTLAILYQNTASGTAKGGFFPSGVNGNIVAV